jgi:hypothetical protein
MFMDIMLGQLIVILVPFMDYEVYANVRQINPDSIVIALKSSVEIPCDEELLCLVVDNDNMFELYTQVMVRKGNLIYVKKPENRELSAIEKRKFNRVDCRIGFMGNTVSISNIPLPNTDKKFMGTILNISGGGVLIETNLNLPVDMVFHFKLKLNFFLDCKARVLRTSVVDKNFFQCGCQFLDSDQETIKTISIYAFREKLKPIRKEWNQIKLNHGG